MKKDSSRKENKKRNIEEIEINLGGEMRNIIKRRSDEEGKEDDIKILIERKMKDFMRGKNEEKIDDLIIIEGKKKEKDIIEDIVKIEIEGRNKKIERNMEEIEEIEEILILNEGKKKGKGMINKEGRFKKMRKKNIEGKEKVEEKINEWNKRKLDKMKREIGRKERILSIGIDILGDEVEKRMLKKILERKLEKDKIMSKRLNGEGIKEKLGNLKKKLGWDLESFCGEVKKKIIERIKKLRVDSVIERKMERIEDENINERMNGVVEEKGMNRIKKRIIEEEGEREVGKEEGNMEMRKCEEDLKSGIDEIEEVIIVLIDEGRERKNIRIENDVLRREKKMLGKDFIGEGEDLDIEGMSIRM